MKTIMKIMLVLAIVSVSVMEMKAQYLAEMPSAGFQSTSSMVSSGSQYQSAAVSGYVSAEDYYRSTGYRADARRAVLLDDDDDFEDEEDPEEREGPLPIGDGVLVLLLLAGGFALLQKRKAASVER